MNSSAAPVESHGSSQSDSNIKEVQTPSSMLILTTLLFFDQYYTYFMVTATLLLSCFKLWALPYPAGYWTIEFIVLIFYLALSTTRI